MAALRPGETTIVVRLPIATKERLNRVSTAYGQTLSDTVRDILDLQLVRAIDTLDQMERTAISPPASAEPTAEPIDGEDSSQ